MGLAAAVTGVHAEKEEIVHPCPLGNFPEFLGTAVFHHHRRDFEVHDERAADNDRPLSFLDKTGAGFFSRFRWDFSSHAV